jgi:hypothetical protein
MIVAACGDERTTAAGGTATGGDRDGGVGGGGVQAGGSGATATSGALTGGTGGGASVGVGVGGAGGAGGAQGGSVEAGSGAGGGDSGGAPGAGNVGGMAGAGGDAQDCRDTGCKDGEYCEVNEYYFCQWEGNFGAIERTTRCVPFELECESTSSCECVGNPCPPGRCGEQDSSVVVTCWSGCYG